MLQVTEHSISTVFLENIQLSKFNEFRTAINEPTGNFFYDPWVLKQEFKNTIWESIYDSLKETDKGEARIIRLEAGNCYTLHADIDDRYHLNLSGDNCYLLDMESKTMHGLSPDGKWYLMNAGLLHTAINLGPKVRYQLVIRKLLKRSTCSDLTNLKITSNIDNLDTSRFYFDNQASGWLNEQNKKGNIDNFNYSKDYVKLSVNTNLVSELEHLLYKNFSIEIL